MFSFFLPKNKSMKRTVDGHNDETTQASMSREKVKVSFCYWFGIAIGDWSALSGAICYFGLQFFIPTKDHCHF